MWLDSNGDGWVWDGTEWTNVGPIRGPEGDQGPQGATGATGPTGATGATGPEGPIGPQGIQGPQGVKGDTGDQGIQGPVGSTGADSTVPGPQGPQGNPGATGPAGADSTVPGPQGPQGVKGDTGATGSQGPQGVKGDTGTAGAPGAAGSQGPAGPGVAAGGTTDQVLAKASATDYATKWSTLPVASETVKGLIELADSTDMVLDQATNAITPAMLSASMKSGFGGGGNGHYITQAISVKNGTAYTLAVADAGTLLQFTNAAAITVTVPAGTYFTGTTIDLIQTGTGRITVIGAAGVTINGQTAVGIPISTARYAIVRLEIYAANMWTMSGDLVAASAALTSPIIIPDDVGVSYPALRFGAGDGANGTAPNPYHYEFNLYGDRLRLFSNRQPASPIAEFGLAAVDTQLFKLGSWEIEVDASGYMRWYWGTDRTNVEMSVNSVGDGYFRGNLGVIGASNLTGRVTAADFVSSSAYYYGGGGNIILSSNGAGYAQLSGYSATMWN